MSSPADVVSLERFGSPTDDYDGARGKELAKLLGLPRVFLFREVSSTLDVAHELAAASCEPGTLVVADSQTAGRGRMGRHWRSEAGSGVWLSLVERPASHDPSSVVSIRVALDLAAALDPFADSPVCIKWPNDLYLPNGKLAGVLLEARWRAPRLDWIAVGVGVNVSLRPSNSTGFSAAGLRPGTNRVAVLRAVVPAIRRAVLAGGRLSSDELATYQTRDVARGKRVRAPAAGTVTGLSADGALLIETATGRAACRGGSLVLEEVDDSLGGEHR